MNARKQASEYERQLEESQERYQAFIQNSSEGIWRFEMEQPISVKLPVKKQLELFFKHAYLAEANESFSRMYGIDDLKSLIGARLGDFLPPDDPENIAYLTAFIKNGYRLSGVESHEITPAGEERYFRNSLIGIIEDGQIKRAWGSQQDVTEQRRVTEKLKLSEERLSLALQSSMMGLWEWNVETGELYWSNELKKLYGLKLSEQVDYEKYQSLIHPDDRAHITEVIERHRTSGAMYQFEHRIIWPNGAVHWMLGKGRAILVDGKAVRMIGTTTNIDDVKQADELADALKLLKKQRVQLLELNKTKDEFIALASHQLRTPATSVKQYIGLLLEEFAGPLTADQEQYLQVAFDSNERQLRIIDDLLKTAQIDSSLYVLDKKKQNIADIIRGSTAELADMLASRRQSVRFENLEDVILDIDASEVKLVILNLLENASKYSHPGTTIRIIMKRRKRDVSIHVIDTGVGIDAKDQKRIFEKFTRINNELSDTVTGTGFGLYWVKRIVGLHGGTIKVRSAPGKGSEFIINFPYEVSGKD